MCGFVAVAQYAEGPLLGSTVVAAMRDTLRHRGPDDSTLETVDGWVTLGHRRLSIIDLEGARQPLRSEDGQVVCIFNGEIYNFRELRSRLEALGHRFATHGDGEVIVHGYEQWGDGIFEKLEGMYAVAMVDRRRQRTLLARDRFGIKPVVYRIEQGHVVAASELKALIGTAAAPQASRTGLVLGAVRMHVPWPFTAFHGIYQLPPGALLEVTRGREPRLLRGISLAPAANGTEKRRPEEALEALREAVARQMVADVPVGAFLSGGVDSTLIVSLMREVSNRDIHTFSVSTVDHDESKVAAQTARELGTIHHTVRMEELTFEDLVELPALYDEPFAETSALGVRALSRFAREHVKVALSGDGGDEIFGGYASYRWIRASHPLELPGTTSIASLVHRLLSERRWSQTSRRLLRALLIVADAPEAAQRDASTLSWAVDHVARRLSEQLSARIERACGNALTDLDPARLAMLADRLERLPNAMLHKVDIASMSASLEVRVPMLDDALVRFADRVSTRELVGLRRGKLLLRRVLERLPGGAIAWDVKRGFTLPLERWMKSPTIAPRFQDLFADHRDRVRELTGTDVDDLWGRFVAGRSRYSAGTAAMHLLWFANVALWAQRFGIRTSVDTSIDAAPVV